MLLNIIIGIAIGWYIPKWILTRNSFIRVLVSFICTILVAIIGFGAVLAFEGLMLEHTPEVAIPRSIIVIVNAILFWAFSVIRHIRKDRSAPKEADH